MLNIKTDQTSLNGSNNKIPRPNVYLDGERDEEQPTITKETDNKNEKKPEQAEQEMRNDDLDFDQNCGILSRIFFFNLVVFSVKIKKALQKGLELSLKLIPKIKESHKVEEVSKDLFESIHRLQSTSSLAPMKIFKEVVKFYKKDISITLLLAALDAGFKLFNSIALNLCIQKMIDQNKSSAFGWGGAVIGSMFLSATFRHGSWLIGQNIFSRVRLVFVNVLYTKISKLSSYKIKEANLGKVINLVSGDLNSTELKGFFLFNIMISPFIFIAVLIILYFRLGPYGLLSVLFLSFVFPVQKYFGQKASVNLGQRVGKSDERVKLISEAIEGIRLIKMYAWEEAFGKMVDKIRETEVASSMMASNYQQVEKAFSKCFVLLVACIVFCIIHYGGYELNSAKIFSTIEMLQYIRINIMLFSGLGIGYIFELRIFLNRFIDILRIEETEMTSINSKNQQTEQLPLLDTSIIARFSDFSAFWENPEKKKQTEIQTEAAQIMIDTQKDGQIKPALKSLNLTVKKGELLGVVGKIGSGKSTFLQSFLKEIPFFEGIFQLDEGAEKLSVAYVEQEPYIFSSTVRENILFGKEFDEKWYAEVVKSSSLLPDFEEMQKGDMTLIGERGINISGGQKARISLARAVYSKAELYLLDDPLSAVDSKVAKKLFNDCIKGILKNKTRILVTHQIHYTKDCDKILFFEDGAISQEGNFGQMEEQLKKLTAGQLKFESSSNSSKQPEQNQIDEQQLELVEQEKEKLKKTKQIINKLKEKKAPENLKVTFRTYQRFLKLISQEICGFPVILLISFVGSELTFTAFNRGLGYYDSTTSDDMGKLFAFLFSTSVFFVIINAFKYIFLSNGILIGGRRLHSQMFKSLTRSTILYFDETQSGNLVNKFSNDMSIIDNALSYSANDGFDIFFYLCNLMITCCVINPYVIIPAAFEVIIFSLFLVYSKDLIIKTKVLDLAHKSPVFQFFQSTLNGVIPIKIYGQKQNFANSMVNLCNNSTQTNIIYWLTGRFFGVFVQYVAIIGSGIGIFIIIDQSSDNPGLAGQSLTYFMMMTDSVQWCLRQLLNLDSVMSSCERSYHMIDTPSEPQLITDYDRENNLNNDTQKTAEVKPMNQIWPTQGCLEFKDVVMKYSKDLNPVLKGVSFLITPGQKIGCVGRTGAGKSSILQALFRMTEAEEGSKIILDGQDTSKLGLHTLRQNISIIPQVPFVFAGTIRRNLDPLNEYSESALWEAMRLVELDSHVKKNCPNLLDTDMTNVQNVFSVGQKQLICLARAILKKNKLLVLDEATANVDMETDNLIQKTIREKFNDNSVLTIAHRLNTIADYDKVIVMDHGQVVEYEEPFLLLANSKSDMSICKDTLFAQMVKHTGKNNSANIFENAKKKYFTTHADEEF